MGVITMQNVISLHTAVFHSLEEQIAVIDQTGNILDVNFAWQAFGTENGLTAEYSWIGKNYLKPISDSAASGDSLAEDALNGISSVITGIREVVILEYPCHSPDEKRWFTMRVAPLHHGESKNLFVISHHNVTQRKLAEERVEQLAMHDPLTELANRRAFLLFLNREMRISVRNQTPIGLVLLDVDYFKSFNDEFGHAAGDQCLTNVARVLLDHTRRPSDLAARIGGDEFALIFGGAGPEAVREIAESILKAILDLKMVFGDSKQVTASLGMVSVIPHDQLNELCLLQEADKALYLAKSAGRNQVVLATASHAMK